MTEHVAVYGGSFDPPHVGHMLAATWVATSTQVSRVILVPTFSHALGKEHGASFEHRIAMCERLARLLPACTVSDVERHLPAPSLTLKTLEALRAAMPETTFHLVLGADIAAQTSRWHRWDDIVALAAPLWLGRDGYPTPEGALATFPEVSSTEIRARLARGDAAAGLLPNTVREHILEHRLYTEAT